MTLADLDPMERPLLDPWPEFGQLMSWTRSKTYRAVANGDLPTIQICGRSKIVTARLLDMLGLHGDTGHDGSPDIRLVS